MTMTRIRTPVIPSLAPARAARGASWFDEHHRSWWSGINTREFQVANYSKCPLAWMYGDYEKGVTRVLAIMETPRMDYSMIVDFGFDSPLGPDEDREAYHRALQVAWLKEIVARQSGRSN